MTVQGLRPGLLGGRLPGEGQLASVQGGSILCWVMNERSFTGWSALWLQGPAEDALLGSKVGRLPSRRGLSPLPVVSPEELGRLRAGRKVEFIQSGVGSASSSGASSPSGSEAWRIKVTDGLATRVLVCVGGGESVCTGSGV